MGLCASAQDAAASPGGDPLAGIREPLSNTERGEKFIQHNTRYRVPVFRVNLYTVQ